MSAVTVDAETALTPEGFAAVLREQLEGEIQVYPARAWYPSSIGHPCDRFLVWNFTKWQEKARHGWVLQSIFDEGHLHQPAMYRRLEQMGFDIVRESDRPTQYTLRNGARISGRLDGKLRGFRGQRYQPLRVLEIKSASPHTWERLDSIEDIRQAPEHYIRNYADQGFIYSLLEDLPAGAIVLKNKLTGVPKVIPYEIDYARAGELLERVERLQPMVDRKEDPPPIPYDDRICGDCPFEKLCYPPKSYGDGVVVIEDAGLVEMLDEREQFKGARDRYEAADKAVKAKLKREGVRDAIAGPWHIEAKDRNVKGYTVEPRVDTVFSIERLEPAKGDDRRSA